MLLLDTLRAIKHAQHTDKSEAVQTLCAMWIRLFYHECQQPYIVWNNPERMEDE